MVDRTFWITYNRGIEWMNERLDGPIEAISTICLFICLNNHQ